MLTLKFLLSLNTIRTQTQILLKLKLILKIQTIKKSFKKEKQRN